MTLPNTFSNGQYADADKVYGNDVYLEGLCTAIEDAQIASDAAIDPTKVAPTLTGNTNLHEDIDDLDARLLTIEGAETASLADMARMRRPWVEGLSVSISGAIATIPDGAYLTLEGSRMAIGEHTFNLQDGKVYALKAVITDAALAITAEDITATSAEFILATVDSIDAAGLDCVISGTGALSVMGAHGVFVTGTLKGVEFDVAWVDGSTVHFSFPLGTGHGVVAGDKLFLRLNQASNRDLDYDVTAPYAILARIGFASSGNAAVYQNYNNRGQEVAWKDNVVESDWSNEVAVGAATTSFTYISLGTLKGPIKSINGFLAFKVEASTGPPIVYAYVLQSMSNMNANVSAAYKGLCIIIRGASLVLGVSDAFRVLFADSYGDTTPTDKPAVAYRAKVWVEYI